MSKESRELDRQIKVLKSKYQEVFGHAKGKEVLEDLARAFYFYGTTFRTGVRDEHLFAEGQRSVVLYIKGMLEPINTSLEEDEKEDE